MAAPARATRSARVFVQRLRSDQELKALIYVYFTVFVDMLGGALFTPTLPFLVGAQPHPESFSAEELHGLDVGTAASIVMSSYAFTQMFSDLSSGRLSDRFGRRIVLIVLLLGGTVGFALQGVGIMRGDFVLFLAARCLAGLFGGSRSVAVSYIADASAPEKRPKRLGLLSVCATFAVTFGSVLGGSLGSVHLALPCYVMAGVSLLGAVLVWMHVPEVSPQDASEEDASAQSGDTKVESANRITLYLNALFSFMLGFWLLAKVTGCSLLFSTEFGFTPNDIGLASLVDGLMVLVANPIFLGMIKCIRIPSAGVIGCVLMVSATFCAFTSSTPLSLVFGFISSIGIPIAMPVVSNIVTQVAPPQTRGAWTGMTVAAQSLGRAVGPLAFGYVLDIDQHWAFLLLGGSAVCAAGLCLMLVPFVPMPGEAGLQQAALQQVTEPQLSMSSTRVEELLSDALIAGLRQRRQYWEDQLELVRAGQDLAPVPVSFERREAAKGELIEWLAELLDIRGYWNWPENLEGLKLMLYNTFPRLRISSQEDRLTDAIYLYNAHIHMAESSANFQSSV